MLDFHLPSQNTRPEENSGRIKREEENPRCLGNLQCRRRDSCYNKRVPTEEIVIKIQSVLP